ncbi:MAG: 2-methylfumaryl-CoA isomerase [Alphaproteobacteria bacterium]|nr:2-methylfumaryl-CoA isomerase [Alphaproteobacteria bacterium]
MNRMLAGMRVIEGSAFVAAPLAGMTLAQMGARVIRFDPIGGGLDFRRWPVTADGQSLYWAGLNKGKQSIALDIRKPAGRELATALIAAPGPEAGIFLSNFPPSGWLAYDGLRARRPDLIMVNILGNRDGSSEVDYTINPAMGLPLMTGDGRVPVNHVLPAWDLATGFSAVNGLLAAERKRARDGQGQYVGVALSDVALGALAALGFIAEAELSGRDRPAYGNDLFGAFGRDFPTKDGRRVMLVAITERQWQGLRAATGLAEAFDALGGRLGLDLAREGDRFAAREEIAGLLAPWCRQRTLAEIARAMRASGAAFGPYQSVTQLLAEDVRAAAAGPLFSPLEQPGIGRFRVPGSPLDFAASPRQAPVRAPQLGEHTDQVLAEVLGLDTGAIGKLHDEGVVAGPTLSA